MWLTLAVSINNLILHTMLKQLLNLSSPWQLLADSASIIQMRYSAKRVDTYGAFVF